MAGNGIEGVIGNMNPKFSIVIPVYNVAPYLRECLDSVLAQTFTDWEAICVDDGSTDESGAILDEYAMIDSRLRVAHQSNAGVSVARNMALDCAFGEWIVFLDADDKLKSTYLNRIFVATTKWPDACCVRTGWTRCFDGKSEPIIQDDIAACKLQLGVSSIEAFWLLISNCGYPFVNCIKRSALGSVRFSPGVRFREDALYSFGLATKGLSLVVVPECGYMYRERSDGAMRSPRKRSDTYVLLKEYLCVWKQLAPKGASIVRACQDSSTRWVVKDVREWYTHCPSRTAQDGFRVWRLFFRLWVAGAVRIGCCESLACKVRTTLYLLTTLGLSFTMPVRFWHDN